MHIKSVEFIGAIGQVGQAAPEAAKGLPQVAFSGRSNVGKSSLINRLLGRTRTPIARVSQQPGKTQEINFYHVRTDRGEFCLVDLPGYGYARVPQALRGRWQPLIDGFLRNSPELVGVVQLIDIRHGPTADDSRAIEYLADAGIPVLFALTKSDKLTVTRRTRAVCEIVSALGLRSDQVIPFSATTGEGRDDLVESLAALVASDDGVAMDESA
ncbi:MAG TPA: ribosome biogenesis GTP-binding protein YihA/YsxC [Longimicrobiaceae bacterium]|nr:ribosome biogenesis GTP-binding protein YihA/YsxC [Longimicrobiaceae bacterium]